MGNHPSPVGPVAGGDVAVLANDAHGEYGTYFAFDVGEMTGALGRPPQHQEVLQVQRQREGDGIHESQAIKIIKIFTDGTAGASNGDGNGRLEPKSDAAAGDWKVGDVLRIQPREAASLDCSRTGPSVESVEEFADKVVKQFKVVAFDMDQCAVRRHSRGCLKRSAVADFALDASPGFVMVVKELAKRGVGLAIATHSDIAEHSFLKPRETHILGDDLVHEVLRRAVPEQAHIFFVVAFNPSARGAKDPDDQHKKRHLRTIASFYNVEISECLLFDDDDRNCTDNEISRCKFQGKFHACRSDPSNGFKLTDLE